MLTSVLYEFDTIICEEQKNYIFQFVKGRKLTDIYHAHDFYEWIWFLKGSGTQRINEAEYTERANTVVMLCPGDRHCFVTQSEDIEVVSLSVRKKEFEMFAGAYDPFLLKHMDSGESPKRFQARGEINPDTFRKTAQEITEYDCKLLLSWFLNTYIACTDCLSSSTGEPQMLLAAIEEMKKAGNLKRGIPAFVELSHYSQSHLSRLIKKYYHMSLKQYINDLRLQSAYRDMVLTNRPAEEIAENLGFSSFSHFSKIFRENFSVTPAALRKKNGVWTV